MRLRRISTLLRWVTALLVVLDPTVGGNLNAAQEPPPAATNELTFFGWSDQHVLPSGEGTHLHAAFLRTPLWIGLADNAGDDDARKWWQKAYELLSGMKERGIMLATDEHLLPVLRQKLGR